MERPNTVSGLKAKRDQLVALRSDLDAQARKITCDIDHLEAAIELFDPANTPEAVHQYTVKHRAKKGHTKRFMIAYLRDNPGFYSSRDLTNAWIAERRLRADDATYVILRKRISACLAHMRADGMVTNGPMDGEYKTWGRVELTTETRAAFAARHKFIQ